jgi:hypothetical protein
LDSSYAVCGVICNADSFEHIAEFGRAKQQWLSRFLELAHGIPPADTFERVFARIDPKQFKRCFVDWVKAISDLTKGEIIAVDGKTLCRSHDKCDGKAAIHMVSAWAAANGLVLYQTITQDKSNEITAIPQLLKMLEIKGCIITIDAMGCQKAIAETIVEQKADYVFSLKGNHSLLQDDVNLFFKIKKNMILSRYRTIITKAPTPSMVKLKSVDIGQLQISTGFKKKRTG